MTETTKSIKKEKSGWGVNVYFGGGILGNVLFILLAPPLSIAVGASGAIAGVMGAYMVLYPRARVTVLIVFFFIQFVALPAKIVLGIWFAMQLFMSMTNVSAGGGVAWMAHVGGFAFGYGLLRLLVKATGRGAPRGHRAYRVTWR